MINFVCGVLALVLISLFAGGLAVSIWMNTGSISFPVIVAFVLVLCYIDFIQSLRSKREDG